MSSCAATDVNSGYKICFNPQSGFKTNQKWDYIPGFWSSGY